MFDYLQAAEVRDAFEKFGVRYLFLGKSGAVLLGFPDTTQDVDVFVEKSLTNGQNLVLALQELGFDLTQRQIGSVQMGQDFVQLKNGPFDLDLIFAPDGIETFIEAWDRQVQVDGFRVCNLDDITANSEILWNFRAMRVRTGQRFLMKWRRISSEWNQKTLSCK